MPSITASIVGARESKWSETRRFFSAFLRDRASVSSVIPTSPFAIKRICGKIDGSKRRVIVEYGPGTGGVARELLKHGKLTADSQVILIEKDKDLSEMLQQSIHDPRVQIFHDSAENVKDILRACGEESADYVLLSIPLTVMTPTVREHILRATRDVMKNDDSRLIAYLFHPIVQQYIRRFFPSMKVEWELLNVPPLHIIEAKK
jgi:phospholipid N-methyltransferase